MSGGFDSGYRDERDAALARLAALETELRDHDARSDHAKKEAGKQAIVDRLDTLSKGRRRMTYVSIAFGALILIGIVTSLARGKVDEDLGGAVMGVIIAALFVHGARTPFREERALQKELDAMSRDAKRDEILQALDEARALAKDPTP